MLKAPKVPGRVGEGTLASSNLGRSFMRFWSLRLLFLPSLLVMAGCQVTPSTLPMAEPSPAADCRWSMAGVPPQEILRRAVTVLEADGFLIRHTHLALGLVSAERSQVLSGYGDFDDPWGRHGFFGGFGVGGGRGGFSTGAMVGFGGGFGGINREATRIERVSLAAGSDAVRVSRDLRLFDWRGDLLESRTASDADFCRELRRDIDSLPSGGRS